MTQPAGAAYVQWGPQGPVYFDANQRQIVQDAMQQQAPQGPPQPAPPQGNMGIAGPVASGAGMASGGALASMLSGSPGAATATEGALGIGLGSSGAAASTPVAGAAPMTVGAPAAASPGLFGGAGAFLAPAAVAGIGAYTAHTGLRGHKAGQEQGGGAMGGLRAGIREAGWLNAVPVLGQAAWLGGAIGGQFGSKKGKDQRSRDKGRAQLEALGLRDAGNRGFITLPDGTQVDLSTVGPDGGPSYNLDESQFNDPEFGEDIGTMNALIGTAAGGNGKRTSDLVGETVNAYRGRGGSRGAVQDTKARIEAAGGSNGSIKHGIAEAWKRGDITANERDARFAATDKLYGIKNPNDNRWENQAGLSQKEQGRNAKEQQQHRQRSTDSKRGK